MKKRKSEFTGRCRITSMEMWDQEFVGEEVPGYFNFAEGGLGDFQFGYVRCDIDWRETERDEEPTIEFSFEGMDEMDPCSGRGWAKTNGETLDGMIYFHRGDESGFNPGRKEV